MIMLTCQRESFLCKHCVKKLGKDPSLSTTCEAQNCNVPYVTSNSKHLCKKHEMDDRHRSALESAHRPRPATQPTLKGIDKSKLYRVNPDEEMKENKLDYRKKRKRQPTIENSERYIGPHTSDDIGSQGSRISMEPTKIPSRAKRNTREDTQQLLRNVSKAKEIGISNPFQMTSHLNSIYKPLPECDVSTSSMQLSLTMYVPYISLRITHADVDMKAKFE